MPRVKLFKCTGSFMSSACPPGKVLLISANSLHQVCACVRPAGRRYLPAPRAAWSCTTPGPPARLPAQSPCP